MKHLWVASLLALAMLASSCSAPDPGLTSSPEGEAIAERESARPTPGEKAARSGERGPKGRGERRGGEVSAGGAGAPAGGGAGPQAGQPAGLLFPDTGRYVFRQSGYEEFCQATCEREDLPRRQPVDVFHRSTTERAAVVVTQAKASDGRTTRTTTRFTRSQAFITELYSRFVYEGFEASETIRPDPPIQSLRLPFTVGERWTGSWDDEVSGDYEISIARRASLRVGGRRIETIEVGSVIEFRGRYEGRAELTAWIDQETAGVVATSGSLSIRSAFGRYNSEFRTTLLRGPGYR